MSKSQSGELVGYSYTDEMIQYIVESREVGISFVDIANQFNEEFQDQIAKPKSAETIRGQYLRYCEYSSVELVKDKIKKKSTAIRLEEAKKAYSPEDTDISKLDARVILAIQDQHMPYEHPDMFDFLRAIKKKYKPTLIVNMGDEVDNHAISFHDNDCDLPGAGHELELAISKLQELESIFPNMILLDSNHGSLAVRKFKHHGIPMKYLKSLNEVYGVSKNWKWVPDLTLILPNGQEAYFCHGISKNGIKLATQRGVCTIEGHFHTEMKIEYAGNPDKLIWSMQAGCLIDKHAMAFAYDKLNLNRPTIGTGIIINGHPRLLPMVLNKNGRWIGELV